MNSYPVEFYKTIFTRQWRWRIKAYPNRKIVGASTESFKNKSDCVENYRMVKNSHEPDLNFK